MADPTGIFNWRRVDARLTTSGQPTEAELVLLQQLGIAHIVNLGLHSHERALPDEAGSVRALGLTYTHLPVDFQNPTEADYQAFRAAMEKLKGERVHVHCIANYRVSAFLYRYQRDVEGRDEAEARRDMEEIWTPTGVWADLIGRSG